MSIPESELLPLLANKDTIHTISLKVANKPGVLVRIALVFSRRGFNIESLVVSPALNGRFSRMTITSQGDPGRIEQIIKQLSKLVDVVEAHEHVKHNIVEKELGLVKIKADEKNRPHILQIVDHFKAITVDLTAESLIVQITGSSEKLDAFINMAQKYGIVELVRTGKVAIARGLTST